MIVMLHNIGCATKTTSGLQRPPVRKIFFGYNNSAAYFVDVSCVCVNVQTQDSPSMNSVRSVSVNEQKADRKRMNLIFDSDKETFRVDEESEF